MAILYNNIIASKESEPEIYEQYRRVMSRFAMEQIEQEHVDDNLAVVYEDMLELGLVNEELAKCLSNILFAHKLVIMQPHMVRAIVYQKQMKDPQIVPIVNGSSSGASAVHFSRYDPASIRGSSRYGTLWIYLWPFPSSNKMAYSLQKRDT